MRRTHGRYAQRAQERKDAGRCPKCGFDENHGAEFTPGRTLCNHCLHKAKIWRAGHIDHIRARRGVQKARGPAYSMYNFTIIYKAARRMHPIQHEMIAKLMSLTNLSRATIYRYIQEIK